VKQETNIWLSFGVDLPNKNCCFACVPKCVYESWLAFYHVVQSKFFVVLLFMYSSHVHWYLYINNMNYNCSLWNCNICDWGNVRWNIFLAVQLSRCQLLLVGSWVMTKAVWTRVADIILMMKSLTTDGCLIKNTFYGPLCHEWTRYICIIVYDWKQSYQWLLSQQIGKLC